MKLFGSLLLALLPGIAVAASSGYGISIALQSPLVQETDAGTVITATFLITNQLDEDNTFNVLLDLPAGWVSIPFEEPFLQLKAHETKVSWIAIRVPPGTLAGTYPITYSLQGRENPSMLSQSSFSILVLGKKGIEASILEAPKSKVAGSFYSVLFSLTNTGNTETDVEISLNDSAQFDISLDCPLALRLNSNETKVVTVQVNTPKDLDNLLLHYINISIQIQGDPKSIKYLYTTVDIFPKKVTKVGKYELLPMKTVFGYGMKNSRKQLFIEQYMSGTLDTEKKKHIDAFARIPFINNVNVDRDLGGLPENGYLHYWDPLIDLYGGDGVYTLTPLTMLNRFGRGASLSLSPGPVTMKGLYLQDTSSIAQTAAGGGLSYSPIEPLTFSASLLQHYFPKESQLILNTQNQEMSQSLMAHYKHKTYGNHTAEYARTGRILGPLKDANSYYIYSRANPFKNSWYALQMIYAEPEFVGYYEDTGQIYGSIGFPLLKKMQGTISYNAISYNLKINPQYDRNAPRTKNIYGGLSYTFTFGLYASIYCNFLKSKNKLDGLGYNTQYATLNAGQTFKHWTLQGIVEYGKYQHRINSVADRSWQSYQIYAYYQPTARQQYAIYTRLGYIQLSHDINWARVYGGSSTWTATPSLKLQLLYEYTDQVNYRNYFSGRAEYTLNNRHSFELKGYVNKQSQQDNVTEFLLSYTIPWGLPIRRKKSQSNIWGKVITQESGGKEKPYPNLIVHCNGQRTITDRKGNFDFPSLMPGDYHVWTEERNQDWVSSDPLPKTIHLEKGDIKETNICFEHPASLTGEIPLFNFSQESDEVEKEGYLTNASILIESTATKERIFSTTDSNGAFSFEHLSPGRWVLKVLSSNIPPYHYLEDKELLIDLFPGDSKTVTLKVLPIKRELRMIDTDTVHISPK
jgi:hypothetical protein